MDQELFSITLKISLQMHFPVHPLGIKRIAAGKVTEEFCLKCNKKIGVSLQEFMQMKMMQYSTTARTITLVLSVQKLKSWFTS